jgi:hypothetical protein
VLHQAALAAARRVGDRVGQADALSQIGEVSVATDDYPATSAALRQALELFGDLGDRDGRGPALGSLGAVHRYTTPRRWPSPASSAPLRRKHEPWKAPATATSATATPANPPRTWSRPWPSTSASAPPPLARPGNPRPVAARGADPRTRRGLAVFRAPARGPYRLGKG